MREITGLALLRDVLAKLDELKEENLFYLVGTLADQTWGPPFFDGPTGEYYAKLKAVNDARAALRDAFGVAEAWMVPNASKDGMREALGRAVDKLLTGSYGYDEHCRVTWTSA